MNSDQIKTELCRNDFWFMLENACLQAGGGKVAEFRKMRLEDVANIVAQNGIRMVYMPEKHMNSVKVVWEDPRSNNIPFTPPNQPYSPPKKKQLLCDSLDKGEEDETWNPAG